MSCPRCLGDVTLFNCEFVCEVCEAAYRIDEGRPVMISPDNAVFGFLQTTSLTPTKDRYRRGGYLDASVNLARRRMFVRLAELLSERSGSVRVLVVGARGQREWLDPLLTVGDVEVVYSDVDPGAMVDMFCDGHQLPFKDQVFDAVVSTAVLEHVADPPKVAGEMCRVAKIGGLVYSEVPFLQHVHEGPYDFTRFTLSGHRRLFRECVVIDRGLVSGPGTSLLWALDGLASSLSANRRVSKVLKVLTRVTFGWIKYVDYLIANKPAALDSASGTYVLGVRTADVVDDSTIISQYQGAQH